MKTVSPDKAVGSEKIRYGNFFFVKNLKNFVRTVSHTVHDDRQAGILKYSPKITAGEKTIFSH